MRCSADETEIAEAADSLTDLLEADSRPKSQIKRDAAFVRPMRSIIRIVRKRFAAQRKSLLSGQSLRKLHDAINTAGNGRSVVSRADEVHRPGGVADRVSLSEGIRPALVRHRDRTRPRAFTHRQAESDCGSPGDGVRRVTGSVDAPLTDCGRQQAIDLKNRIAGQMPVFTAPNARSRETGRLINDTAQDAQWLRPWDLGRYEGRSLDSSRDSVNRLIAEAPDESPGISPESGKEGESFTQVSRRLIAGVKNQRNRLPNNARVLNITSGRALHIIHAAAKNGFEGVDVSTLVDHPGEFSRPGDLFLLKPWGLDRVDTLSTTQYGQYFAQHGETDWNSSGISESLRESETEDRATFELEISKAISATIHAEPVSAVDQEVFKAAMSRAIDAGADQVSDSLSVDSPKVESFISKYLKDGGFTKLTGELDQTSVNRLASAIADAYESGSDFDGVVSAIKSEFSDFSTNRAKMIAQTELNDAYNQSVFHFGEEAGATKKSWQLDIAPCPICIENSLDGDIDMDEDFSSGDDAPPSHPNCMCSLAVHA